MGMGVVVDWPHSPIVHTMPQLLVGCGAECRVTVVQARALQMQWGRLIPRLECLWSSGNSLLDLMTVGSLLEPRADCNGPHDAGRQLCCLATHWSHLAELLHTECQCMYVRVSDAMHCMSSKPMCHMMGTTACNMET